MPRYYRRRRTVVVRPKKKWGSNIKNFDMVTTGTGTVQGSSVVLVQNAASSSNPTPVILKAGNFKVQGDAFFIAGTVGKADLSLYVVYLPEGVAPADPTAYQALIAAHPEWVIAWKYVSGNLASSAGAISSSETYSFSSRLKRNLNSGDRIMLVALATIPGSAQSQSATFSGMCQYWTCAN